MFSNDIQEDIKGASEIEFKDWRHAIAYEKFRRPPYAGVPTVRICEPVAAGEGSTMYECEKGDRGNK